MHSDPERQDELGRLFGDDALSEWWPHSPRVAHGSPERSPLFAAIPSLAAALELAGEAALWPEGSFARELRLPAEEVARELGDRATAKIEGIDGLLPAISDGLSRLVAELGTPIRRAWANLYVSAEGVGVDEHADGHEVIALQLSGAKDWRLAYAGDIRVFTLTPGSVLFIPRGIRHRTLATAPSLSLSLAFACYTLAEIAAQSIARLVYSRPAWDRVVGPLDGESTADQGVVLDGILREVGAELASGGVLALNAAEGRA